MLAGAGKSGGELGPLPVRRCLGLTPKPSATGDFGNGSGGVGGVLRRIPRLASRRPDEGHRHSRKGHQGRGREEHGEGHSECVCVCVTVLFFAGGAAEELGLIPTVHIISKGRTVFELKIALRQ